jgi:hypothetical protein
VAEAAVGVVEVGTTRAPAAVGVVEGVEGVDAPHSARRLPLPSKTFPTTTSRSNTRAIAASIPLTSEQHAP